MKSFSPGREDTCCIAGNRLPELLYQRQIVLPIDGREEGEDCGCQMSKFSAQFVKSHCTTSPASAPGRLALPASFCAPSRTTMHFLEADTLLHILRVQPHITCRPTLRNALACNSFNQADCLSCDPST